MKPDTDIYRTALRSKNAHAAARFTDKSKVSGIFDRHFFIEVKKTAVDVNERMDFRAVCEIELQTDRREVSPHLKRRYIRLEPRLESIRDLRGLLDF